MKIIILILANDTPYYLKIQDLWRKYMNSHPNIESYFIKYDENLKTDIQEIGDTIYLRGTDSFRPGCFVKSIETFKYILKNKNFDYVVRTNMSSVWDLNKLYKIVYSNNFESAGVLATHAGINYISGAGILLRRDIVALLASIEYTPNLFVETEMADDVLLGYILSINNVYMNALTRFDVSKYYCTPESIKDYYHFRCKCDENWDRAIEIMTDVIKLIYEV
jgi:hypothetical protein